LAQSYATALTRRLTLGLERGLELLLGDRALLDQDLAQASPGCPRGGRRAHVSLIGRKFTQIE
jgi:hypothetical protein